MGGDLEGAENDLITSLNLDPQNVNALVLLGNLMTNKNDDAAALRFYEKAVQLDPKSPDALCNYGTMLFKNGDKLKAFTYLRQAIEYRPDHATAYYMLAQCYAAMEDWHSAYLTARDSFEKCRVSVENAHLTNRIAQGVVHVSGREATPSFWPDGVRTRFRAGPPRGAKLWRDYLEFTHFLSDETRLAPISREFLRL